MTKFESHVKQADRLWRRARRELVIREVFEIRPFAGRLARTLRREAKVYLFDPTEIDDLGAWFENVVALHLRKLVDAWNDAGVSLLPTLIGLAGQQHLADGGNTRARGIRHGLVRDRRRVPYWVEG